MRLDTERLKSARSFISAKTPRQKMGLSKRPSSPFTPTSKPISAVLAATATVICAILPSPAQTITSDSTVGTEVVSSPNRFTITGGTVSGTNLFHSFQDFSAQDWSTVFDLNDISYAGSADNVSAIFSRVSGGNVSNINGLLQVTGGNNPDFFLLNPNGIAFGPNAQLDIDGSFVGSTAESIRFADGIEFAANSGVLNPLLTTSTPVGLQMGVDSRGIQVNDRGYGLLTSSPFTVDSSSSLRVNIGKTLALVGSDITFAGGTVAAPGGRVELGSVREGLVVLNSSNGALSYDTVQSFGDISLFSQSLVDASQALSGPTGVPFYAFAEHGGVVQIQGRRLSFQNGSLALINNSSNHPSGSIRIRASEAIELSGIGSSRRSASGFYTLNFGSGLGGDVNISTQQLRLAEGARIVLDTFGAAPSGNISIAAFDAVLLEPGEIANLSGIVDHAIKTYSYSAGAAGSISIKTGRLANIGGAITSEATRSGNGGSVTLIADQLRVINGASIASGALGSGDGNDVVITANTVEVSGVDTNLSPSFITAGTTNTGNAGSLTINAQKLFVREGGRIDSSTVAAGNAGSVTVNASELVEVSGTIPGSTPSLIISSANILDPSSRAFLEGIGISIPEVPYGVSGNVTITTPALAVSRGAQVTVRNDGMGDAGTLRVDADTLYLNDSAGITASTQQGSGGNIFLDVRDVLLMDNGSRISAEAGGIGDGGNIAITTPAIIALENSDIIANAFQGNGGNIDINTQLLVGTQFRNQLTPESDITASSEFGLSGMVSVEGFESDPNSGLVELPTEVVDSSDQIASSCASSAGNRFIASGRGGLPPPPERLASDRTWNDLRNLSAFRSRSSAQPTASAQSTETLTQTSSPIIEATAWAIDERGQIALIDTASGTEPVVYPVTCASASKSAFPDSTSGIEE